MIWYCSPRCLSDQKSEFSDSEKDDELWRRNGHIIVERKPDAIPSTDRDADRLVTAYAWVGFKREFAAVLYQAGGPMRLSRAVQEAARNEYFVRLAFDLPKAEYPTEADDAALTDANPLFWNLIADLLSGQVTYAGRNIKVLQQSDPELLLQLERPVTPSEELEALTPKV